VTSVAVVAECNPRAFWYWKFLFRFQRRPAILLSGSVVTLPLSYFSDRSLLRASRLDRRCSLKGGPTCMCFRDWRPLPIESEFSSGVGSLFSLLLDGWPWNPFLRVYQPPQWVLPDVLTWLCHTEALLHHCFLSYVGVIEVGLQDVARTPLLHPVVAQGAVDPWIRSGRAECRVPKWTRQRYRRQITKFSGSRPSYYH
jgi:hypothetical protein